MADPYSIQIDAREVLGMLNALSKQAPFAIATAMNRTAEEANKAGRDRALKFFHIREEQVVNYAFPIPIPGKERASKTKLEITLEPERLGKFLKPFEEGTPHTTDRFGRQVAVPSDGSRGLRTTPMTRIPRQLYPVNLGLQLRPDAGGTTLYYALGKGSIKKKLTPFKRNAAGKAVKEGKFSTYEITTKSGLTLIFQRNIGPKAGSRLLWILKPQVRRPRVLEFVNTISSVIEQRYATNLLGAWELAQATAR